MGQVRVLVESDLRSAVGFGQEELGAIEAVYPLISSGEGSMPPIMRIDVPAHHGEIDIKAAYLPGYSGIAVKVSAGFFDNPQRGLPSLGGLMFVFDSETGLPRSTLFDNGYLTDLRTALAGGVAARHLSREDSVEVGVIGGGVQARLQVEALGLVRALESVKIWARRREQAESCAADIRERLHVEVMTVDSPADAARADILVTTTPAAAPLVTPDMLHPGLHITAVGSDAEHKREIATEAIAAADLFVCDSLLQSKRLGELRAAIDGGFNMARAVELGQVIAGEVSGRVSGDDVTICDLTGTGAQDTAIASMAVERAIAAGAGIEIET